MKSFFIEFEMKGHEHRYNCTVESRSEQQARAIFMRDNPRAEIISVTEE